jgi:hypothetical protein
LHLFLFACCFSSPVIPLHLSFQQHNAHECNGEHSVIDEFVNDDDLLEEFIADCSIPSVNTRSRRRSASISSTVTPTQADEPPITQESDQAGAEAVDQDGLQSGEAFIVPSDFNSGRFCFANNDCAMMRIMSHL